MSLFAKVRLYEKYRVKMQWKEVKGPGSSQARWVVLGRSKTPTRKS
jgi:hypothetical protein